MADFDNKKHKLGLDRMDAGERKDMFRKFIKHGGKVVDEKKEEAVSFDRAKQKELIDKMADAKDRAKKGFIDSDYDSATEDIESDKEERRWVSFWDRVAVHFKGLFNKTVTFFGGQVHENFFQFIKTKAIPQMKTLNSIINYIITSDEKSYEEIKNSLNKKELYYYPLLLKYAELYVEDEFSSLLYYHRTPGIKKVTPRHLEEPLKKIMYKIYLLKAFKTGALNTFRTALFIIGKHKNWGKIVHRREMNHVRLAINLLFSQLLPKFYSLILFILKENVYLDSNRIIRYLGIQDEDRIDYAAKKKSEIADMLPQVSQEKEEPEEEEEEKKKEIKYIKKYFHELTEEDLKNMEADGFLIEGIKLMQEVDWKTIAEEQKKELPVDRCPENDKILRILGFLKEFEKEYSFILTSPKIIIKPLYEENKRIDYKAQLSDMYTPLTGLYESMQSYFEVVKSIDDVNNDPAMQEYDKYNRINKYEGQRGKISLEFRKRLLNYFAELQLYFDKFIDDYNGMKKIIESPDEELNFDKEIEGEKKVEGKKVIEAIGMADAFISAFVFRLEENGDFAGVGMEIEQYDVPTGKQEEEEQKKSSQISFLDEIADTINKE